MATKITNRSHLCLSISQHLGEGVTVTQLADHLANLIRMGRGHYRVQIDDDQMGDPLDLENMQVFDAEQIVELTHK